MGTYPKHPCRLAWSDTRRSPAVGVSSFLERSDHRGQRNAKASDSLSHNTVDLIALVEKAVTIRTESSKFPWASNSICVFGVIKKCMSMIQYVFYTNSFGNFFAVDRLASVILEIHSLKKGSKWTSLG